MNIVVGHSGACMPCSMHVPNRTLLCTRRNLRCGVKEVKLCRSRRNIITRASEKNEDAILFTTKALQELTEEQIQRLRKEIEEDRGAMMTLEQKLKEESNVVMLAVYRSSLRAGKYAQDQQENWLNTLNRFNDIVKSYPPESSAMQPIGKFVEDLDLDPSKDKEVADTRLVMSGLGRAVGALIFCWGAQTFFGALPYELWQAPEQDAIMTWAMWTAPFVGLTLGTIALSDPQHPWLPVRPVTTLEEKADEECYPLAGPVSVGVYSLAAAYAAGLVFRGVWLNSIADKFVGGDAFTAQDPNLLEQTLRSSMGSLVPTSAVPIPAVLLLTGAVAATATLETLWRLTNALVSITTLEVIETDGMDLSDAEIVGEKPFTAQVSTVGVPEVNLPQRLVTELLVSLFLAAETVATNSLWASLGTHAVAYVAAIYAFKARRQPVSNKN